MLALLRAQGPEEIYCGEHKTRMFLRHTLDAILCKHSLTGATAGADEVATKTQGD